MARDRRAANPMQATMRGLIDDPMQPRCGADPRSPYGADVLNHNHRGRGRPSGRRLAILAVGTLLALTACGADGIDDGPAASVDDGPRVADARFDGRFDIVEVVVDEDPIALTQQPTIEIEAQFGGLTVLPGCNTYFGSFTLAEDGRASFTVTGGSEQDCGPLDDQEAAVLAVLGAVDQWVEADTGFRLSGAGSSLSIAGSPG